MTTTAGFRWAAILGIAAGTFALRFSFLYLVGYVDELSPRVELALRLVPAAVLAALVAPAVLLVDGGVAVAGNERLLAAGVAAVVGWRTGHLLWTATAGFLALTLLQGLP